jgi:hypothetical protein
MRVTGLMHGLPILIDSGIREVYGLVADTTADWLVIHGRGYISQPATKVCSAAHPY